MKKQLTLFFAACMIGLASWATAPVITAFTPTSGPVGTLVTIIGSNLSSPTAFTIAGVSAIVVSDNGTTLVGMVMPGASTGAVSVTTAGGGPATISSSFTVTPTRYPSVQQGSKLVGTGATGVAAQGYAVAVSADGNTAIVGGSGDNAGAGAAWIYSRSGTAWAQQGAKLVGTGAVGTAEQGSAVSISADGNTAIVGGYTDNSSTGAVWVYTRSGSTWTQQGSKLVGTGTTFSPLGAGAAQGHAVALSADGNTAIVGGFADNSDVGAAWVFTRSGGAWTQQGSKLIGTGGVGTSEQGNSVALSADGNTAMVGGYDDNGLVGAVWVYTRSGGVWTQQGAKLVGTGATGTAGQGSSVALSADGNTAIIGGEIDNSHVGAAWIYTRSGPTWTQQGGKLVGTGATGTSEQGSGVSISADGNTAIVGGFQDNSNSGGAWIYTRSGSTWTQQGGELVGTGAIGHTQQGYAVSMSANGTTAMVGGSFDNLEIGAVWVYAPVVLPVPSITSFSPGHGPVGTLVTITGTNLSSPLAFTIGGVSAVVVSNTGTTLVGMVMPGAVTGSVSITVAGGVATGIGSFTPAATLFPSAQQGSKLVGTGVFDAPFGADQGYAVAISSDGNTAVSGGPGDNSGTGDGAVWVYTRSGTAWSQQGSKLVGTGGSGPGLGSAVAISADGNTIIAGGPDDNGSVGGVWIFTRSGGVWTQQGAELIGSPVLPLYEYYQGIAVSISADGNTAIAGAGFIPGGAWVFTRSGGVWTQQGSILQGTGAAAGGSSHEASAVALSADGNTAMIGAFADQIYVGAAWVFTRSGSTWTQQGGKLIGTGASGTAYQGFSVALSADGNTGLVGGTGDNSGAGAMWVYTRSGGIWTQQGSKLVGSGAINASGSGANQGTSVSLSADGNVAMEGGYFDNNGIGAAWVFTRSGSTWTQQGSKLIGTGAVNGTGGAQQGQSVCLSANGTTAIVGGFYDNSGLGAAWVYTSSGCTQPPTTVSIVANNTNLDIPGNILLTATPVDAGTAAFYTWYLNGVQISTDHSSSMPYGGALGNGDQIYCTFTSTACGVPQTVTSNIVTFTRSGSSAKDITGFTMPDQIGTSVIDPIGATVSAVVSLLPAQRTAIHPIHIYISTGATYGPSEANNQNFSLPVTYTVRAQDGSTKVWTVTVVDGAGQRLDAGDGSTGAPAIVGLELFPNPASNYINAVMQGGTEQPVVTILDLSGRVMYNQQLPALETVNHQIDVSAYASGAYIINIVVGDRSETKKFIVTR